MRTAWRARATTTLTTRTPSHRFGGTMSDADRIAACEAALAKLIAGKAPKTSTACQKVIRAYVGKAEGEPTSEPE